MAIYENLSAELEARILRERADGSFKKIAFRDEDAVRRTDNPHDRGNVLRSNFIRDADKIINCPFYNRYADKTQVFSFYRNDDITRRALHVQLVSRIARTIGRALNLNVELIEAIALGHDIGHTPFGHAGERYLSEILFEHTGRYFNHNVHSVRVLDEIFPLNLTLQTLSGILAHDGELELSEYRPRPAYSFALLDEETARCREDRSYIGELVPSTLEGCVVRIGDIIAYLGKDRQDAARVRLFSSALFSDSLIGKINAEIVNNLTVNLIEMSYGKDYIKLDEAHFAALKQAKEEDYRLIYRNEELNRELDEHVKPMMRDLYDRLLADLKAGNKNSPVYRHHVKFLSESYYKRKTPYEETEPNQIVTDYIASMTDDYFVDLYACLFPDGHSIAFRPYFR